MTDWITAARYINPGGFDFARWDPYAITFRLRSPASATSPIRQYQVSGEINSVSYADRYRAFVFSEPRGIIHFP